jgi:hypothetical protein
LRNIQTKIIKETKEVNEEKKKQHIYEYMSKRRNVKLNEKENNNNKKEILIY